MLLTSIVLPDVFHIAAPEAGGRGKEGINMSDTHRVIVFKNTFLTFKAENALKAAGISCKVVTKPRHVSSDCGLAVRFESADEERVTALMAEKTIEYLGVW